MTSTIAAAEKQKRGPQKPLLPPLQNESSSQAHDHEQRIEIEEVDETNTVIARYVQSRNRGTELNVASGGTNEIEKGGVESSGEGGRVERVDVEQLRTNRIASYSKVLVDAFLPVGFPESVTADYLEYQIYDSLQAFSSSIAGMLSSRAVLEGIGVGSTHTTPTAALLLSILQSSLGRLATIAFASRLSSSLEPECKAYRFLADIFNDCAIVLDCISPALPPPARVSALCGASVLRALCGVAAGSAKASLSAHFAKRGNVGELSAKDSSQETVISLMGMLVGSLLVPYITTASTTWICLLTLLSIHLYTNYCAVRAVCLPSLNCQRANLVFSHYFSHHLTLEEGEKSTSNREKHQFLAPREVFIHERIFENPSVLRHDGIILGYCRIGVLMSELLAAFQKSSSHRTSVSALVDTYKDVPYVLHLTSATRTVLVALKEHSQSVYLQAWYHAFTIVEAFSRGVNVDAGFLQDRAESVERVWEGIRDGLGKAGWDVDDVAILTVGRGRVRIGRGLGGRSEEGKKVV